MTITLNKTNKNYKRSQNGRSMVEMLGVLAIVGVLSVGGVYGYGVAMKKHKANELLHQASMLATTISAQAMTNDGKLPQTITSFGNSNYGTFSPSTTDALDGKGFSIEISNMDSAVCKQMEKMAGGMVQGASCSGTTLTLTYYKNLATTEAEGEKSPTGGNSGTSDPLCKDVKCETGEECVGGNCIKSKTTDGSCAKNSDCDEWCVTNGGDEKCYCAINASRTNKDSACWENFTGQCAVATTQSGIKGGYVASRDIINWWSAVNFCKAHDNKSLVSLADFGITGGYQDDGYCFYPDCTGPDPWSDLPDYSNSYWATDAASCNVNTWKCTSGTNNNSCHVFYMEFNSGNVNNLSRDLGDPYGHHALCK